MYLEVLTVDGEHAVIRYITTGGQMAHISSPDDLMPGELLCKLDRFHSIPATHAIFGGSRLKGTNYEQE